MFKNIFLSFLYFTIHRFLQNTGNSTLVQVKKVFVCSSIGHPSCKMRDSYCMLASTWGTYMVLIDIDMITMIQNLFSFWLFGKETMKTVYKYQ